MPVGAPMCVFSTLHVAVVIGSSSHCITWYILSWFPFWFHLNASTLCAERDLLLHWLQWLYPTRLETRTKESSVCASILTFSFVCGMKVNFGKFFLHRQPTFVF